jgi:large subunit ribosomal protein L18
MEETLMAKSSNYRVQLRRRREGKTDYQARKALVISRRPRLVTRTSNRNVTAQIIIAKPKGDEVLAAANSRELTKFGWKAPTGNIPAAYLTGLLCGLKAKAKGVEEAILDIGIATPTKGAKIFATLNGVVDAGITVPHSEEKIVKERTKGDHIAKYAKSLGAGSEEYTAKFSQYTAQGVAPEKVAEHFNKVKAEIVGSFKGAKVAVEAEAKALKSEAKAAPKAEPKAAPKAAAKVEAKAAPKEKAPAKEKAPKEKAAKEKAAPSKSKVAPKEKATKEKAPKKGEKKA